MSSKRGRKRNDDLPSNRARDVQRTFRARRAAHLQALERRLDELEQENGYFRQALNLPPSSRPPLGRGPTGQDKPYDDADSFRHQKISPSGESVGCSSYSSSPELGHSLIAPSISSRVVAVEDADASHRTDPMAVNERHTDPRSEQGHAIGRSIPSMPFKTSNCSDHPLQLHFPSSATYTQKTSTGYLQSPVRSSESIFSAREPRMEVRDEIRHDLYGRSQNNKNSDQNSDQYLHTIGARMCLQSRQDPNPIQSSSFRSHPHSRFPPEQAHSSHSVQHPQCSWSQGRECDIPVKITAVQR